MEKSDENSSPCDVEDEEEKTTSSMDNIIPVKQISHGWNVLRGFAQKACHVTMEKVEEINQSETMGKVKANTNVAWMKTVEVSHEAAEKTKEIALKLSEDMKPVSERVATGAKKGWDIAAETAKTTVDVTTKAVHNLSQVLGDGQREGEGEGGSKEGMDS